MTGPIIISPGTGNGAPVAGRGKTVLDLTRLHFDHVTHGIRVMGTWHRGEPRGPCLVLALPGADLGRITPFLVPMATVWRWDEQMGDPVLAECMAADAAQMMGLNPFDKTTRHRIMAAVRGRIQDLLVMPPEPTPDRILQGHLIARKEDGTTENLEVHDDA